LCVPDAVLPPYLAHNSFSSVNGGCPTHQQQQLMETLRAELGSSVRIGLLHLSDEHVKFFWHEGYAMADFVWRNYWQDSLPHSVQQHWNGIPESRAGWTLLFFYFFLLLLANSAGSLIYSLPTC
jgi:hypothetical protein